MSSRKYRKLGVLAKIETTYGTDAVPTAAANAMQVNNATITPLAGGEEARDLMLPWLGNQGVILTGNYVQMEFSVEVAGAKAAGTVPGYGALLRACGMAETVTAGTSVAYNPISAGEEAVSIYYNVDGVRHVALGCRATVAIDLTPSRIPHFRFTVMGLLGTVTDQALPAATYGAFAVPVEASKANTTATLFARALVAETLTIDLSARIEPRFLIGKESMELTGRQTSGSATVEAELLAGYDWFAASRNRTKGALSIVHGKTAGNIVQFTAPRVEIGRPTQGESQGIVNYTLPLMLTPVAGNDELVITVK